MEENNQLSDQIVDNEILIKKPRAKKRKKTVKAKKHIKNVLNNETNSYSTDLKSDIAFSAKSSKPIRIYRKIAISFTILTALLVGVIFYFSLVKVIIVLIPNQENISDNLSIDVYDQEKNVTLGNDVAAGVVKQVEVTESKTYQATGKTILSQEVIGKVTIINDHNKSQPLTATTRLFSANNKLFRIKNTVNVPAGGRVEVDVYADESSKEMAVGPTKFTIPGLWAGLQDKIYGQSQTAMEYKEKVKITIEQKDIEQAANDLKLALVVKTKNQIDNDFKSYDQVIYEIDNNTLTQQVDSKVGEEKEQFNLTIKTMVTVVAFADEKIFELAKQKLVSSLADDKELINFNKKDVTYSLDNFDLNQGVATIKTSFIGKITLKKDAELIDKNKIFGLTNEQLSQYLNNIPEIAGYEIKFQPSFIKKVPNLIDRIKIEIKE
ncbi:MAG: hypothetical protein ABH818_01065 [Patescibacteria group bacterium]|nr:hypothetical protein [Patescibacteria group bacterium]MBU1870802.1 hypothetical protein [Patescibacteria group bacterium]